MNDDSDDAGDIWIDDNRSGVVSRWLPRAVVVFTVLAFAALAVYAYRAGTQSFDENDLIVVEADKTPMKETPEDPGGMKFPNQDKTVFETFSGNTPPPKVERVMPPPEEPIAKPVAEATVADSPPVAAVVPVPAEPAKPVVLDNNIVSYTMDKALNEKTAEKPAPVKVVTPIVKKTDNVKGTRVQLGAYRSDKEARESFAKLEKKFPVLSNKKPIVAKADLGAKGVYYRLRVGGFASAEDAKEFCKGIAAKGQACILAP